MDFVIGMGIGFVIGFLGVPFTILFLDRVLDGRNDHIIKR
mgnify:CR=1 FL=1